METVRVGGHRYSDPDVVALIRAGGGLADPRSLVLTQARRLNGRYRMFEVSGVAPFDRLKHLASLTGLDITPMNVERRKGETRDAVVILNGNAKGKRGQILFNPDRPAGRIAFSIAHEIAHTFFPNTSGGARFREMCHSDSREGNELERLCDLAASELLMPIEEFRSEVGENWSLSCVPKLASHFGSSYEATCFRLASAHPGIAAAGLIKHRLSKQEARAVHGKRLTLGQSSLFTEKLSAPLKPPPPKYRRQSFHTSDAFPDEFWIPWNKSFDQDSIVYRASDQPVVAQETLPNGSERCGTLEVVTAPYQREDASLNYPDLIFLWVAGANAGI